MIHRDLTRELSDIVGRDHVCDGATDAEVYSYDGSLATGAPDAVVFPASTEETAGVVRAAVRAGVPCIPRGFGTNLSGGSVAPSGGIVVCLSRMNRIVAIDTARRWASVEPGVTNLELQEALAPLGFYFAPDPASQKVSTLGGNIGENSGGPHCLRYGVTTNHVLGMQAVLPTGETVRLGGPALDPPGYDLRGLLIGSEGTLGIATRIDVRILPLPECVATFLAIYDDVAAAARSVSGIIARGIVPATLEMMDALVMRAVEESFPCGYPHDAAAVLIIEVEGPAAGLDAQAASIRDVCEANGCRSIRRARDAAERDQLWAGRRGAFGAIARIAPNFLVADCTVPRTRLPEALERVAAIGKAHGFKHGNVFHAGDGNLHPLLFFDARDADQLRRVHIAGTEIMRACVDLGGTITGEHGVGVEKLDAMRMVFSEVDLRFQAAIRTALDPHGLLNPGKAVPISNEAETRDERAPIEPGDAPTPADADEACAIVCGAIHKGVALLPLGGGRRADFGNASDAPLVPLSSARLAGVVEHDLANQVVTFGSGTPLAAAQEFLAEDAQWLPLRPPLADACTLGGIVALGACGPERLAHGAPRDRLLGLKFVAGNGRLVAAGGRVVKNVTGYDVTRLLTGSAGTLGFLTSLTFRVASRPEVCRLATARGSLEGCAAAAAELLSSRLEPVFVAATRGAEGWQIGVGFEGFAQTVAAQLTGCSAVLEKAGLDEAAASDYPLLEGPHAGAWQQIHQAPFVLHVGLPLDATASFIGDASEALDGAPLLLDFGCGRISAGLDALSADHWSRFCGLAVAAHGHAMLEKAPDEFKRQHDVFGSPRPGWKIVHRLKKALDPHGVFAPGRLPGRK